MAPALEVADVFRAHGESYRQAQGSGMPHSHRRVMNAIEICRTSKLGGHVEACDNCGHLRISYNSCRNRHCPKCQSLPCEKWLSERRRELLPVPYFHAILTIPSELRPLALQNRHVCWGNLFRAGPASLMELSRDPKYLGAQIGIIAVLHTWSQTLLDHPHLHCIIPSGGLSLDGSRWIFGNKKFFLPLKVVGRKFRGKFLDALKKAYQRGELQFAGKIAHLGSKAAFNRFLADLYAIEWGVHVKPSFKNPGRVLDYLGRYTHRVAISNHRLIRMADDQVTFSYRDSADRNRRKQMTLSAHEFIRRFLLHVLPSRFVRIRHYGILSNCNKRRKLVFSQELLGARVEPPEAHPAESWQEKLLRLTGIDLFTCPICHKGIMRPQENVISMSARSPPIECITGTAIACF